MTTLHEAVKVIADSVEKLAFQMPAPNPYTPRFVMLVIALREALAQPDLTTCNCRWDGETQVQQCTLHEAHVDAIHEWAERAKTAEKALAQQGEQQYDKTEMNAFVQNLYDQKMLEGKHGHYETMFNVVHAAIRKAHGIEATPAAQPCKVCEEVHAILDTDKSMIIRDAKDGYPEGRASRTLTLQERVKALCIYAADWKRWYEETQAAPAAQPIPLAATCHCACVVQEGQVTELCKMHSKLVSPAAQPTCKQDLPVETEQERYVRMCPDIECGRKKRCTRMVGVSCMSRADIAPAAQPELTACGRMSKS